MDWISSLHKLNYFLLLSDLQIKFLKLTHWQWSKDFLDRMLGHYFTASHIICHVIALKMLQKAPPLQKQIYIKNHLPVWSEMLKRFADFFLALLQNSPMDFTSRSFECHVFLLYCLCFCFKPQLRICIFRKCCFGIILEPQKLLIVQSSYSQERCGSLRNQIILWGKPNLKSSLRSKYKRKWCIITWTFSDNTGQLANC